MTIGTIDKQTWEAMGFSCDSNGNVIKANSNYLYYLNEAKTLGYGHGLMFQVTDIDLNSISVHVPYPEGKTIKIYDEANYPIDIGTGLYVDSHTFNSSNGDYTFSGLQEGHSYGIAVYDANGERMMLEQGIRTNYKLNGRVAIPYDEYKNTYGQTQKPTPWGEANSTSAEMSDFHCSQEIFVNYGLMDYNNDGIKDGEDLDLWPSLIPVKNYYFPNLGFSVYECPFKPGYFNSDPYQALLGNTQCFIESGQTTKYSTLSDLNKLNNDHWFDTWKSALWKSAKIFISLGFDMFTTFEFAVEAATAEFAYVVASAFADFITPNPTTLGVAAITSAGDYMVEGSLPTDNMGQWIRDLLPFIGTYDAIKEAFVYDGGLKGIFVDEQ